MNYAEYYNSLVLSLMQRELAPEDGISEDAIAAAEERLSLQLPAALREYYRVAGDLDELNLAHNRLEKLAQLDVIEDYLVFMEENQVVVLWGIKISDLDQSDPEVWQGVNVEPMEWYSEGMTVSEFLLKHLPGQWVLKMKKRDQKIKFKQWVRATLIRFVSVANYATSNSMDKS